MTNREKTSRVSWPLYTALFGAVQPPLHMFLNRLLKTAQGERVEELAFGFLTGIVAWGLCAIATLLGCKHRPQFKGRPLTLVLSWVGLILFVWLAALFALQALWVPTS